MQEAKVPPHIRTGSMGLSVWQSIIADTAKAAISLHNEGMSLMDVHSQALLHPMVLGTNLFVDRKNKTLPDLVSDDLNNSSLATGDNSQQEAVLNSYLSQYYFNAAMQVKAGTMTTLPGHPKEFPDSDYRYTQWVKAASDWLLYWDNPLAPAVPYVDWQQSGKDIHAFGVITIPENARIAIIGDFGTGLPDATIMLMALIKDLQPDLIIHLGDIYYSGTEAECITYTKVFTEAFTWLGISPIPVFSIPGNHEYLSGGLGFFKHVIGMNADKNLQHYNQEASYFCLRTAEHNWQFLGMDTGRNSVEGNVFTILTKAYAPWLEPSEILWHADKLENFSGKTILLSHHQLFSASAVIVDEGASYINQHLQDTFSKYYDKVAAWFWGHEHILGIFAENETGLSKGRLIGNSGYEEWEGEGAYEINPKLNPKPLYPYLSPLVSVNVDAVAWNSESYNFYEHGFALVQLHGASATVDYYQYPVMQPDAAVPPPDQLQQPAKLHFTDSL